MEAVNTLGDNVDETAVGGDGRVRRPRARRLVGTVAALSAAAALALSGALVLGTPAEATAATSSMSTSTTATSTAKPGVATPDAAAPAATTTTETDGTADTTAATAAPAERTATKATPAPTGTPAPLLGSLPPDAGGSGSGSPTPTPTDRPAVRPTIADPGDVTTATVRLHGTGTPGHTVRITGPVGTGCTATVGADGSWACMATVRSGPQQVFSVTDRDDTVLGSSSAPASDVVVPPSVTTAGPTAGPLSGTGLPGATVTVGVVGARGEAVATVRADGTWTVALGSVAAQDGRLTVTASQTASTAGGYRSDLRSAASTPRTVTLDRTPPSAPRIETPRSGSTIDAAGTTIAGSGEPGATVTAYVDRAPVCRTRVGDDGRWRCSTEGSVLSGGTHAVTALQQDAAGNVSPSSPAIRVRASGSTTSPSTAPGTPSSTASNASPTGPPGRTAGATPGTTPTAGGVVPGSASSDPGGTTGGSGTAGDPGSRGVPDWSGPAGDWAAATTYDRGVPSLAASFSWGTVLVATAVAAGFLVLVTTPLALVGAAARGRLRTSWLRNPFAGVLGRNRTRAERRLGDDVLPTWAAVALGVGIVTVATLLGVGVGLEARYVRLAVAVLAGSAVLTAAVVVATRWAAGRDRGTVGFHVSPWLVLAALVACALTRTTDVSPALVVGAVLVPVGRPVADTGALRLGSVLAAGVRSATARTGALLVVTVVGWTLHSVTPDTGFWAALGSEFATTLCVGGIGALVVSLVPVAGSAGATLLDAARGRYVGLAVASLALAAAVYAGSAVRPTGPGVVTAVATAAVALLVVGWWWQRRPGAAVGGDTAR
ncbi:hypothetical protein DEU32_101118 [Curtobacterium sp. AG1037]|uniref:Ig-like domain-containing protein n=1 Tax=Curtobacterium sp. AG1037 TaxID=2183990 RepID=UPI000E0A1C72|nr:Ig-like domain-containing protein [Curtobacterium sp. AG1037]RDI02214.1 hypothetical protein DEU32_101118 [Curtobacterium sp. AG1037]